MSPASRCEWAGSDPLMIDYHDKERGFVRNRLKVESAISNARCYLNIQDTFGSFDSYLWAFVGGAPVTHRFRSLRDLPAQTEISAALSKDLKGHGFRFVGPTICYAFMRAVGMVNDHVSDCFRYRELA